MGQTHQIQQAQRQAGHQSTPSFSGQQVSLSTKSPSGQQYTGNSMPVTSLSHPQSGGGNPQRHSSQEEDTINDPLLIFNDDICFPENA